MSAIRPARTLTPHSPITESRGPRTGVNQIPLYQNSGDPTSGTDHRSDQVGNSPRLSIDEWQRPEDRADGRIHRLKGGRRTVETCIRGGRRALGPVAAPATRPVTGCSPFSCGRTPARVRSRGDRGPITATQSTNDHRNNAPSRTRWEEVGDWTATEALLEV